jgi:hypothetical protein
MKKYSAVLTKNNKEQTNFINHKQLGIWDVAEGRAANTAQ